MERIIWKLMSVPIVTGGLKEGVIV